MIKNQQYVNGRFEPIKTCDNVTTKRAAYQNEYAKLIKHLRSQKKNERK